MEPMAFRLKVESRDKSRHTVWCNAMAGNRNTTAVYLLSIGGPSTVIKAVHAMLIADARATYNPQGAGDLGYLDYTSEREHGYRFVKRRLGPCNTWHLLAISQDPRFLPNATLDALTARLMSDKFTTPLLPNWCAYLAKMMIEFNLMIPLSGAGCGPALINMLDDDLDDLVQKGLQDGRISISSDYTQAV